MELKVESQSQSGSVKRGSPRSDFFGSNVEPRTRYAKVYQKCKKLDPKRQQTRFAVLKIAPRKQCHSSVVGLLHHALDNVRATAEIWQTDWRHGFHWSKCLLTFCGLGFITAVGSCGLTKDLRLTNSLNSTFLFWYKLKNWSETTDITNDMQQVQLGPPYPTHFSWLSSFHVV